MTKAHDPQVNTSTPPKSSAEAPKSTFSAQGWMDQVKDQSERLMAHTQGAFAQMMHFNQRCLEEGQKLMNVQRGLQEQWVETMMGAARNLRAE